MTIHRLVTELAFTLSSLKFKYPRGYDLDGPEKHATKSEPSSNPKIKSDHRRQRVAHEGRGDEHKTNLRTRSEGGLHHHILYN